MIVQGPLPVGRLPEESLTEIWGRRAVSIGAVCSVFVLILAVGVVLVPGLLVWDAVTAGRGRIPRTRCLLFIMVYLLCEILGLVGAASLWLFTLGGVVGGHSRYRSLNFALQSLWTEALFRAVRWIYKVEVAVEGLDQVQPSPFLLWVRHTSLADTVLAAVMIANPHRIGLRYVLKRELLWDPCLDVVGRRLPNVFVDRSRRRSDLELASVQALARDLGAGQGVLIYPEGTRFSAKKLEASLQRLAKGERQDLYRLAQELRQVLPPRLGGPLALLDAAPDADVLMLAHCGLEGASTLRGFWSGALLGQVLKVRITRIPRASIPSEGRDVWLFERWAELDRWVTSQGGNTENSCS